MRSRLPVLLAGLAVLVAVVVLTAAWATKERRFVASAPQPPPLYETLFVPILPQERACLEGGTAMPRGDVAQFRVKTGPRGGGPLRVFISGPGYDQRVTIPAGFRNNDVLSARITPPERPLHVQVCWKNRGPRTISLFAADDETPTLEAGANGEEIGQLPVLRFLESGRGTLGGHASDIARDVTVFRPPFVGTWLVWPLGVLVVLGLPALLTFAVWRALREPG